MEKVQICYVYITPSSCVSLTKNIEHYLTRMSIKVNSLHTSISVSNFTNSVHVHRFHKNSTLIKQQTLYTKNKEECLGGYSGSS